MAVQSQLAARSELVAKFFLPTPSRPSFVLEAVTVAAGSVAMVAGHSLLTSPGLGSAADGPAALVLLAGLAAVTATLMHSAGKLLRHRAALGRALPKATGAQFDEWLAAAVRQAVAGAGQQSSAPQVFVGIPDLARYPWNQVADEGGGQLRFSLYEILVVHVLDHRLITYAEVHDMRSGERRSPVITEFPLATVDGLRTVVVTAAQAAGPAQGATVLGQAVDRTAFAATSEVSRVRQLQLLAQGRVAAQLIVGVATRKRGEPEGISDDRQLEEAVTAFNARLSGADQPSQRRSWENSGSHSSR
jgi:hypothetical protein